MLPCYEQTMVAIVAIDLFDLVIQLLPSLVPRTPAFMRGAGLAAALHGVVTLLHEAVVVFVAVLLLHNGLGLKALRRSLGAAAGYGGLCLVASCYALAESGPTDGAVVHLGFQLVQATFFSVLACGARCGESSRRVETSRVESSVARRRVTRVCCGGRAARGAEGDDHRSLDETTRQWIAPPPPPACVVALSWRN